MTDYKKAQEALTAAIEALGALASLPAEVLRELDTHATSYNNELVLQQKDVFMDNFDSLGLHLGEVEHKLQREVEK